MPLTIRMTDTSVPQAWILEDASPFNDGIMTAAMARKLAGLSGGGLTPGTFGDSSHVAQIVVNAEGGIQSIADVAISGGGGGALAAGVEQYVGGLGTLVIPVAFSVALASANYSPSVQFGYTGASQGPPPSSWWPSDLTKNGFNINLQADPGNDMQAFWAVSALTQ